MKESKITETALYLTFKPGDEVFAIDVGMFLLSTHLIRFS